MQINCLLQRQLSRMSMSKIDERLYHYEYRRPRMNNPTYNSSNVFESINMMTRIDPQSSQLRFYGRYTLSNNKSTLENKSEILSSRYHRQPDNYLASLPPAGISKQTKLLNDKDYLYFQMLDQQNRNRVERKNSYDMRGSHLSQNAENRSQYNSKKEDSLTREIKEFDSYRK